ncbi:DUF2252 domain-containing protein [Solirubrobacter soli]|uniref:DUF2252 domain-containing protein n=1 Tax=Solirubrobacter soli TaxID=363832 RepID=UPI0003FFBD57|nr:DUF2252 domain-containing protein [Solirubrobacter soli]
MTATVFSTPRRASARSGARLSADESAALGRAARKAVPRASHADWAPAADRRPVLDIILAEEEGRLEELLPLRHGRMLASPFAFYRAAAAVMAADLHGTPDSGLRTQLCGDAHVSNFGGFASPERALVFDLNDFDETAAGPWEWDVKRLAASVAIAGRARGIEAADRARIVQSTVRAYRMAMRDFAAMRTIDVWYARIDAATLVEGARGRVSERERKEFKRKLESRHDKDHLRALTKLTETVDGRLRIASRPPLLVPIEELASEAVGGVAEAAMRKLLALYKRSLKSDRRHLLAGYEYAHLARKVVGVGSVGTRAWVVMLTGRDDNDPLFLQVKEAGRSALEPYTGKDPAPNHGQRVVQGQWLMQAASDIFLGWLRTPGIDGVERDFYVRQLWDWKTSADLETIAPDRLEIYGELCGRTLARAHARAGDRVAIASYLGGGDVFDRALATFAESYADCNDRDHAALTEAVRAGAIAIESEP